MLFRVCWMTTFPIDYIARQRGQAMAEFVVITAGVLMALFVIVPLFGKVLDMRHQTQQASRYVAWERTVWFDQGEAPDETTDEYVALRSDYLVEQSARNRFFYTGRNGAIRAIGNDDLATENGVELNPLWVYTQNRQTMFDSHGLSDPGQLAGEDTPAFAYDVLDVFNTGMDFVTAPMNAVLNFLGNSNDDFLTIAHEVRNYHRPAVTTQLHANNASDGEQAGRLNNREHIENWIYEAGWDGTFQARSAILADGWNAQGPEHFQERTNDLVLSTVMDNAVLNTFIDVVSIFEESIGELDFGHVDTEPMSEGEVSCVLGFCYFEEDD